MSSQYPNTYLSTRARFVGPHHLPWRKLVRAVPGLQIQTLVTFEGIMDDAEKSVGLDLVNANIVANHEHYFADLPLLAILVPDLVLVQAKADIDTCLSGPRGMNSEPMEQFPKICLLDLFV
jgi:hypothetical protein